MATEDPSQVEVVAITDGRGTQARFKAGGGEYGGQLPDVGHHAAGNRHRTQIHRRHEQNPHRSRRRQICSTS